MSHNCEKTQAQVYLYLDQELTLWRRVRIWWHLKRCPPCGDGFVFERKLKQRVHDDCREEPPRELYDRLRAFLRENETDDTDVA
jgi:mycothiol system anti-sigma-R factor